MKKVSARGIIAILLVVVLLVCGLAWVTSGFTNWDAKTWFGKEELPNSGVVDDNGNELVGGKVYPMTNKMTFSKLTTESTSASTGINLSATVTPVDASYKQLDWKVSFVNPSSAWAMGKDVNSYMSLTVNSDTSIANLKCLDHFSEQIKITVIAVANPSAKAECTIDYLKRVLGHKIGYGTDFVFDTRDTNDTKTVKYGTTQGGAFHKEDIIVGTKGTAPTLNNLKVEFSVNKAVKDAVNRLGPEFDFSPDGGLLGSSSSVDITMAFGNNLLLSDYGTLDMLFPATRSSSGDFYNYSLTADLSTLFALFNRVSSEIYDMIVINVLITGVYSNNTNLSCTAKFSYDFSSKYVNVSDVVLGDATLEF